MQDHTLEKIRAFGLAALYISLTMITLLLILASFKLWPHSDGLMHHISVVGTAFTSVLAAMSTARAGHRIIHAINNKFPLPALELIPFFLTSLCFIFSSWLLIGIDGS